MTDLVPERTAAMETTKTNAVQGRITDLGEEYNRQRDNAGSRRDMVQSRGPAFSLQRRLTVRPPLDARLTKFPSSASNLLDTEGAMHQPFEEAGFSEDEEDAFSGEGGRESSTPVFPRNSEPRSTRRRRVNLADDSSTTARLPSNEGNGEVQVRVPPLNTVTGRSRSKSGYHPKPQSTGIPQTGKRVTKTYGSQGKPLTLVTEPGVSAPPSRKRKEPTAEDPVSLQGLRKKRKGVVEIQELDEEDFLPGSIEEVLITDFEDHSISRYVWEQIFKQMDTMDGQYVLSDA